MAVYKCKMCGGSLDIAEGTTVCECEYCGTKQTLPKLGNEQTLNMINRASHFRQQCEFDKAEEIYEQLAQNGNDPELYWSIVLCRYGIEYVSDPLTKKKIPTCHRTQYNSILNDADYKMTLSLADMSQRSVYEQEARYINTVQKGTLEISNKEEPFDIFICYKASDENGQRTQDSVIANEIYHELTNDGFKVFFSEITLEDKIGEEYEPYIYAALSSSKIMLVIGTKPEFFNAVWVRNEWSRFMKMMAVDRSKKLFPCYRDMDPYDLPEAFVHLQALDMTKIGFITDLMRGIHKILDDGRTYQNNQAVQSGSSGSAQSDPLIQRIKLFVEDSNYEKAAEYCERVLDNDPTNPYAYLYKVVIARKFNSIEELATTNGDLLEDPDFQKALRFADEDLSVKLKSLANESLYNYGIDNLKRLDGNININNYYDVNNFRIYSMSALNAFETLGDYKNSRELKERAAKDLQLYVNRLNELQKELDRQKAEEQQRRRAAAAQRVDPVYTETSPVLQPDTQYALPKKKMGCLGKILIAVVVIFVINLILTMGVKKVITDNPDIIGSALDQAGITETEVTTVPLGTEELDLKDYEPFDTVNVDADISENFMPDKSWDNSLRFRAGNGESYAYASYFLDGKFDKLTLRMQPYNYDGDFDSGDTTAELQIIDLDTGNIVYKNSITRESLPIDVEADISGIENMRIMVGKYDGLLAYCVLSDITVYPGEKERNADNPMRKKSYGDDALNLRNVPVYNSQVIDSDVPLQYTLNDHLWTNAMKFRAGNGPAEAYGVWEIGGKYSKLSLEFLPYIYNDGFTGSSTADIQIINAETEEILYSGSVNYESDIMEVTADITGVNYLKINVVKTDGLLAYCLLNDIYVYNE